MQNFTFGRKGLNWFLFAFVLFVGSSYSYGQCADVNDDDAGTAGNQQSYCYLSTVQDLLEQGTDDGDPNTAPANIEIYETADSANDTDPLDRDELLTNATTYFFGDSTDSSCARVPVEVSVDAGPTPQNEITGGRDSFSISPCESSGFTAQELEDLFTNDPGYELEVYDTEFGETALAPGATLTPGDSYFVGQIDDGSGSNCPSTRAAVGYDPLQAPGPTADSNQTYCEGATVADLMASGTETNTQAIRWYRTQTSNSPLADDVELVNNEDYFAAQVVNDRNSPFPPCETVAGERTRVVVEVINFDAGEDVVGVICEDDLRQRIADGEGASILLSFITDGRDLPNDVTFNPSLGALAQQFTENPTQPIITTATFTTPEECTDDVDFNITVNESFNAGDDNTDNTLCRSDIGDGITSTQVENYLLGLLSDDADQDGEFSPSPSDIANDLNNTSDEITFDITYTVGEGTSCEDSANLEVTVLEGADFELVELDPLCNDDIPALVNAIPEDVEALFLENFGGNIPEGEFEEGTIQAVIDQYNQNNIDTFTATFIAETEDGCFESIELERTVIEGEVANAGGFDNIEDVCSNDEIIDLTSLTNTDPNATAGGTFSGDGVTNNSFDPSAVETGDVTITYTVDDSIDCVSGSMETTFTIEVIQGPNAGQDISGSLCLTELEDIVLPNLQNPENIIPDLFNRFDFNGETGGTVQSNLGNDFQQIGASLLAYYTNPNRAASITIEGQYTVGNETDNCGTDVSSFSITIIDGELVDAGSDNTNNTLCNADIPGLVNSVPGDVENLYFDLLEEGVPQNGTFNPTIEEIIADYDSDNFQTFSTIYTIGTEGCSDSVELAITVIEPGQAIAEAMNDEVNVCTSETSYNLNGALSEDSTLGGTFSLNGEELEGNIFDATTVEPGEYSFTYTVSSEDADCIEGSASANFTINVTSDFEFEDNITATLCESEVPENLNADIIEDFYLSLVSGLPSGGTFDTTPEEILAQYNNNPFDTFTATYTVDNGECQGSVVVSVTVQEEGSANAGDIDNQVACTTDGMIALNQYLEGSGAQMGGTFSGEGVTDNMFDASIGASEEGYLITYSINEEDSECIEGEDSTTFRIFVNEPGQAIAEAIDNEINVCTSETSYNLNGALTEDSTLGGTFLLNGEELEGNIFDATTVEPGEYPFTYTVSSEDADCIEGSASADFTINVTSQTFDAGEDVTFTVCSAGLNTTPTIATVRNYFLNLLADDVPTNGTFSPSIEDIREDYLANQIGSFNTTYTIGNGVCEDSVELTVVVTDLIPAEIGDITTPDPICRNAEDVDLFSFLPEDANPNGTFEGYEDGIFSPGMAGVGSFEVTYTLTEDSPCTEGEASATFTITVTESAFAGMDMDLTVCMNDEVQNLFDFISVDADDNGEFTLDGEVIADGMMNPADFEAGEYEVIYTVAAINDCGEDTAEFTITVQEAPDSPTVEGDPFTFCATDGATAADLSATGTNLTYYSDEALSMMVAPEDVLVDGTYYVTQRNDDGACESAATEFTVTINDAATPTISNTTQEFCEFDDATIADLTELINETGTITWYDSADGDNALDSGTSLQDGVTYYATLFNVDTGCESSVRLGVTVSINDDCPLTIPEGFSPNDDQLNDRFEIENIRDKYPNFTIEIRNRFGDVVYKGNANTPDWDGFSTEGSFGSDVLPVGAYFYYLRYNDGSTEPVRGTVYLSR